MEKTWRWFGKKDRITLSMLRQIGVEGIVTAPNLGKCGVKTVCYNFMPVIDWIRTDLHYALPDGSSSLYFNRIRFAYFDLKILQREGAERDYSPEELQKVEELDRRITPEEKAELIDTIIVKTQGFIDGNIQEGEQYPVRKFRELLALYKGIDRQKLRENLCEFLKAVMPVCDEYGVNLCIHPDDPPRSILGLPRIFSTLSDIKWLLSVNTSRANGVCFCSGSFSGRLDNDILAMFDACADRVGFLHLRSTEHLANGDFFEANHLEGVVDMYALVKRIIEEQLRRQVNNRSDWKIPFRPDHGHVMLDDLAKPPVANPGYSAIGRLKGLAELRGLELGIMRSIRM